MKPAASIQKKLLRVIMLICGTALSLTCLALFVYEYITYRDIAKREVITLGQMIASNSTSSLAFDAKDDAAEILRSLKAQKHIVAACLYDNKGKLFASYPATVSPADLPETPRNIGYTFQDNYIEGFEPVVQENVQLGTLYIRSDLKAVYTRFRLYGAIAISFILLSFFFAYLLSKRLQRSISDPILALANKARMISTEGDYSVRAVKTNDDEVGELTDAFNYMLTEIQAQNENIQALNSSLEEKIAVRTKELQEANLSLTEQNEFIQTIIDSSVDVIAVFDRELNYVIVNKQSTIVYDRPKEALIGQNLLELFPALKDSVFIDNINRALNGSLIHQELYKSVAPDHYFENFFIPLKNKEGIVDRVLVMAHDITTIVRANDELRQVNTELEKSNRDLEQFAYVASHDLQEPLRKIQIFSQLLEKNLATPELANNYLQKISSSAGRMSDLIKAVLNYSRMSRTGNEFVPVDLNTIVAQIQTDLELTIEEKKARFHIDDLPLVKAVPLQMSQLFLNLISNALKFCERSPIIRITSTKIGSDGQSPDILELAFHDNGIGFEQQFADQAFSIFQRLHTSDQYAGTGIGLALCKKIVENHGGTIRAESKPGVGTSFFIDFPFKLLIDQTTHLADELVPEQPKL